MENRAHAIVAGLFVVFFAFGALFVLWWFGGQRENLREVTVVSSLPVNGLSPQAVVRYRGVRVGKVKDIAFDRSRSGEIVIRLSIGDDAPLTDRTFARLVFQGVTGMAYLELDDAPGASRPLDAGEHRISLRPSPVTEGIDAGLDVLRQARDVTIKINDLLDEENRRRIRHSLDNLEHLTGQAAKAGAQLPEVLARLNRLVSDDNLARLSATLNNTAEASAQAGEAMREVRQLANNLRTVAERMDAVLVRLDGEALATAPGKLGEMADQVKQAAASVNRVARSLEERPQGLIFGHQPRVPGPGESGFSTGGQ